LGLEFDERNGHINEDEGSPFFLTRLRMENLDLKEEQLGTSILQPRAM
jgi:hypothetical protein